MGLRFHKSLKILPGLRLNISKSGPSLSLGGAGASLNLGKKGARATLGAPGTGLSYTSSKSYGAPGKRIFWILLVLILVILAYNIGAGNGGG